jgi:hypothetical protein
MSNLRRHYIMANKGENYSYIDLSPIKPVLKEG